jgi:glycosyltransferase involved in cell wall biosynthesis
MASGLPVVATSVGGVPEIIQHYRTGFLSDPTDQDSMLRSLTTLMSDPSLRSQTGQRAREYVIANHSPQRLPSILAAVYEEALS